MLRHPIYREIDQSVTIEVGRGDGSRGFVGERDAVGVESTVPLVETDIVDRFVGPIGDDNVRPAIAIEICNSGVPGLPLSPAVG